MYDRILIPTDGGDPATEAAVHAFELADRDGAAVHVLHIVETSHHSLVGPYGATVLSTLEEKGEKATDDLATRAEARDLETATEVRSGHTPNNIIDYADEHGIDLIVMGTHGRSGIERLFLGSVTERVLRGSDVPVFVVRTSADEADSRFNQREEESDRKNIRTL
jgi:nucleotide-binding universal stress UspA family protein